MHGQWWQGCAGLRQKHTLMDNVNREGAEKSFCLDRCRTCVFANTAQVIVRRNGATMALLRKYLPVAA